MNRKVECAADSARYPVRCGFSVKHERLEPDIGRVARRDAVVNHSNVSRGERATVNAHLRLLHQR